MSEENEGPATGQEVLGARVDPAAITLALGGASREEADAFLKDQRILIADQRHHLHEQFKHLHLSVWEKRMGVMLRLATLCVGLTFVATLVWMVWEAAHSDGLKVEPFSVPPAMAERGLTGEVVAARVIDRLSELQSQTNTARPARSYSNAWGDKAIKLEIPETGVSLEEIDSWLRAKVGHETPLTGEVVRSEGGVTLRARTGKDGAVSVSGSEADMDALTAKLAEAIYRLTQPYRYAIYLMRHENRPADAAPIFQQLAQNGDAQERRWSLSMWANATASATGDADLGLRMYQEAHQADPEAGNPIPPMLGLLSGFGRFEEAARLWRERLAQAGSSNLVARSALNRLLGNYSDTLAYDAETARKGSPGIPQSFLLTVLVQDQLGMHERSAARASLARFRPDIALKSIDKAYWSLCIAVDAERWDEARRHLRDMDAYLKESPRNRHTAIARYPALLALMHAQLGDFRAAERTIAPAPADCYPCLIARARIAELAGQRTRADFWFTKATEAGPSLSFADEAWGRAFLERGKPDNAIEKFKLSIANGPHFADPLEGWGEALMAKNQSHLALAKFAEAEKYAPNWGRLHLKWGEALVYAGKKDEAKVQFTRAKQLDLTSLEKAELVRQA